jgi:undecaprenyl-diphosphatase
MMDVVNVVALGVIEGITEFLPISSTGHLLIAEHWLGKRSETFNVVIQAGAILAVTLIYWRRILDLILDWRDPQNRDYALKLIVAFLITAVLGFIAKKLGFALPEAITPVAWALIIGGFWILAVEAYAAKKAEIPYVSWLTAIVVGVAQIVAGVFPGTSRSGASIFAAMLTGTTDRKAATEFAFLVGIPTMYAASGYELLKALKEGGGQEDWAAIGLGFVVSTVVAFIAVKWLLGYIQTHRFTIFAVYRILLGAALLAAAAYGWLA